MYACMYRVLLLTRTCSEAIFKIKQPGALLFMYVCASIYENMSASKRTYVRNLRAYIPFLKEERTRAKRVSSNLIFNESNLCPPKMVNKYNKRELVMIYLIIAH